MMMMTMMMMTSKLQGATYKPPLQQDQSCWDNNPTEMLGAGGTGPAVGYTPAGGSALSCWDSSCLLCGQVRRERGTQYCWAPSMGMASFKGIYTFPFLSIWSQTLKDNV